MGRHITNQAMLLQLLMLTDAMHRGYYTLDNFRYQPQDEEEAKDQAVSRSSSLSIVNYVKRLCFSGRGASALKEMQETLEKLSSMILDVNELVLFLTSYPRLYRQPYSMHLQLVNCMFGRQMESQVVINFLLCKQPHGPEELEVLPITGPGYVDPEMHPRLTYLAMEIAKAMRSSPLSAYITAHVLRDNFEIRFWCKVLSFFRGSFHKHASKYGGEHPLDAIGENKTTCIGRMAIPSEVCVLYHHHHQYSTEDEVPKIAIQDVLYGNVKPRGKFEALAWRSSIPPYYSYVSTCEIQELKTAGVQRKRSMKDRVTLF
ncbi:hypothetical protein HU200_027908 [Digitaria exilis]|uniref:Uncharacterized protein n=1 Tax=Digitaria exilis TaxID=1010633 RepID=A0A835ESZ9_9POAL|nr:hypothetical protein HU200_027908 [Digitaria exilis]